MKNRLNTDFQKGFDAMPDWFHNQEISNAIEEFKRTNQQAQLVMASAGEAIQNMDRLVLKLEQLVDAFGAAVAASHHAR